MLSARGDTMVKTVTKKSGKTEPFIKEKIVVACVKSGAPVSLAREIAAQIEADPSELLETKAIRSRTLEELGKADKAYPEKWRRYDRTLGRTT
jgi:hypothetical protein